MLRLWLQKVLDINLIFLIHTKNGVQSLTYDVIPVLYLSLMLSLHKFFPFFSHCQLYSLLIFCSHLIFCSSTLPCGISGPQSVSMETWGPQR